MSVTNAADAAIDVPDLWAAAHRADRMRPRSRQRLLGPSSIGLCRRRAGYEYHGTWPTDLDDSARAAILGTWLHEGILPILESAYGAYTELEVTNDVLLGHVDAYWPPESLAATLRRPSPYACPVGVVEDVKTSSAHALRRLERQGPGDPHLFQVHLYAYLLRTGSLHSHPHLPTGVPLPVDVVRLRYVGREYGQVVVHQQPYDEAITDRALAWAGEVLASRQPDDLPRDLDGPGLSVICDNCPFKSRCWRLDERPDGEPPQVILADDHDSLVSAVADYAEASAMAAPFRRRMAKARKVLDSAEPGAYGDYQLSWSGGTPKLPQPDVEAMTKILQNLGLSVPTVPGGRTARQISITKATADL
ncbi:hypothetical protein [Streptomyces luteireticuli]|uniref:hypothetical protein n=1 Tax=Streptomyces luteireticuli TaxID=173858 RepID=UPI003556387B